MFGGWVVFMINDIYVDFCFIGIDGFSNMIGLLMFFFFDVFLDCMIILYLDKKYIFGDYIKFECSSLFKICDWLEIIVFIINDYVDKEGIVEVVKYMLVIIC